MPPPAPTTTTTRRRVVALCRSGAHLVSVLSDTSTVSGKEPMHPPSVALCSLYPFTPHLHLNTSNLALPAPPFQIQSGSTQQLTQFKAAFVFCFGYRGGNNELHQPFSSHLLACFLKEDSDCDGWAKRCFFGEEHLMYY